MKTAKERKPVNLIEYLLWGVGIGAILGYIATTLSWDFGYAAAIIMVTACVIFMEGLEYLAELCVYPGFSAFSRGKKLAWQLATSGMVHIIGWIVPVYIGSHIIGFNFFRLEVLLCLAVFIIFAIMISSINLVIRFYRELTRKEVTEEELKKLAAQAELKALRAQINPHFLFNSLNTIANLISTDAQKAERSVERLADIFRYALSASNREFVTLRDELEFIDSYLEIEQARFGDKLKVSKSIPADIIDTPIPGLILQPLVENSIKHGFSTSGDMIITIKGYRNGKAVRIEISDEGKGVPQAVLAGQYGGGTGLRNVKERLEKTWGQGYGLEILQNTPGGTIASITIPGEAE